MKNRKLKTFRIYAICFVATVGILFLLNLIIGDENIWWPTIVNSLVAAAIFIAGNWFSNEDRLRNDVVAKKEDYNLVRESVCRVQSALNIKRRLLHFIYALDENTNSRSMLSDIMKVQQEIEDSINTFKQIKYLITSEPELNEFEKTYKPLEKSFQIVLDGLMKTVNQWCDAQAKSTQASTIVNSIGEKSDKTSYASLYAGSCSNLAKYKKNFLSTFKSQEKTIDSLLDTLNKSANDLLCAESKIIKELESKI